MSAAFVIDWRLVAEAENLKTGGDNHGIEKLIRQYTCLIEAGEFDRAFEVEQKLRAEVLRMALRRYASN